MRLVGWIAFALVCVVLGAWAGALLFLPDAPHPTSVEGAPPVAKNPVAPPPVAGPLLAVPVAGVARTSIRDSWGDPRENGLRQHHGTDIMAPGGSLVTAAAPGTVEKLFASVAGGTTLYIRSPGRRWAYYYAHLSGYAPGLHEGQAVRAGEPIAFVGDTGDAGPGNFHLHFGLIRTAPEQHWWQGEDVDPFPYLAGKPAPR